MPITDTINKFQIETNKVVIFGGSGFLGLHIARQLIKNNYRVILVDSKYRLDKTPEHLFLSKCEKKAINYPYENPKALRSIFEKGDILIHLGWSQVPNENPKSYQNDISNNMSFSVSLFELAITSGVCKIIFASSGGSVYGNSDTIPINEKHHTEPISSYGIAKLTTEQYLNLLTKNSSTNHVILRIGNAYGLHLSPKLTPTGLIPFIINALNNDSILEIWGDGEVLRDFTHVTDIGAAFFAAIETTDLNGIFNIGTGISTSINQLIKLIEKTLGKAAKVHNGSARLCDVKEVVLDASKFKRHTHWAPKVSLKEGLIELASAQSRLE